MELNVKSKNVAQISLSEGLAPLFDLLARFDYEDNKQSVLSTASLVSAPKEAVPSTDSKTIKYEKRAEKKQIN